jgi:hypothetical protein
VPGGSVMPPGTLAPAAMSHRAAGEGRSPHVLVPHGARQ